MTDGNSRARASCCLFSRSPTIRSQPADGFPWLSDAIKYHSQNKQNVLDIKQHGKNFKDVHFAVGWLCSHWLFLSGTHRAAIMFADTCGTENYSALHCCEVKDFRARIYNIWRSDSCWAATRESIRCWRFCLFFRHGALLEKIKMKTDARGGKNRYEEAYRLGFVVFSLSNEFGIILGFVLRQNTRQTGTVNAPFINIYLFLFLRRKLLNRVRKRVRQTLCDDWRRRFSTLQLYIG